MDKRCFTVCIGVNITRKVNEKHKSALGRMLLKSMQICYSEAFSIGPKTQFKTDLVKMGLLDDVPGKSILKLIF